MFEKGSVTYPVLVKKLNSTAEATSYAGNHENLIMSNVSSKNSCLSRKIVAYLYSKLQKLVMSS